MTMTSDRRIRNRYGAHPPINPLTPLGTAAVILAVVVVMTLVGLTASC